MNSSSWRQLCTVLLCCSTQISTVQAAETRSTRVETAVYRCQDPSTATLIFQSLPCHSDHQEQRLRLVHAQPPEPPKPTAAPTSPRKQRETAQRSTRTKRDRSRSNAELTERPAFVRKTRAARAKAGQSTCPPTREGNAPTGSNSLTTAWKRQQSLPSRTYLKNTGKWPGHCPD